MGGTISLPIISTLAATNFVQIAKKQIMSVKNLFLVYPKRKSLYYFSLQVDSSLKTSNSLIPPILVN